MSSLDTRTGKTKARGTISTPGGSGSTTPASIPQGGAEELTPEEGRARAKARAEKRAENARLYKEKIAAGTAENGSKGEGDADTVK
jgi:hypothetical protein